MGEQMISFFRANDERSFKVLTESGATYYLGQPGKDNYRKVHRLDREAATSESFFMDVNEIEGRQNASPSMQRKEFNAYLKAPVNCGQPLILHIKGENRMIISEPVTEISEFHGTL